MITAYRVAVRLGLRNEISPALAAIGGQLRVLNREIQSTQTHLNGAQNRVNAFGQAAVGGFDRARAAAAAYVGVLGGAALLGGTAAMARHGAEIVHQQTLLRAAGQSSQDVARQTARAWEVTGTVIGTSVGANLKAINDIRTVLGEAVDAERILPDVQRINRIVGAVTKKDPGDAGVWMMRTAERRGRTGDPASLAEELRAIERNVIATGGAVGGRELAAFVQQGGLAARGLSTEAMYSVMPSLIQAMGGDRAGTAFAAATRQIMGGVMTQDQMGMFREAGLISSAGRSRRITRAEFNDLRAKGLLNGEDGINYTHRGQNGMVVVSPEGMNGRRDWQQNPFAWAERYLAGPTGYFARRNMTGDQQLDWLQRAFGKETGRRFMGMLTQNRTNIIKDQQNFNRVEGNAGTRILTESPYAGWDALKGAWTTLMEAFGTPAAQASAGFLNGLAVNIQALAVVVAAHPDAARNLTAIAIGLGALLVVSGSLGLLGLALRPAAMMISGAATGVTRALVWLVRRAMATPGAIRAAWMAARAAFWGAVRYVFIAGFIALRPALMAALGFLPPMLIRFAGGLAALAFGPWGILIGVLATVLSCLTDAQWKAIKDAFLGLNSALTTAREAIVDWIVGLPRRIMEAIRGSAPSETGEVNDPAAQTRRRGNFGNRALMAPGLPPNAALDPALRSLLPGATVAPSPGGDAQPQARPMSYAPAGGSRETVVPISIQLDGDVVYRGMTRRLARDANRPPTGSARPDPSMSPFYPGAVGAST